jgi:hypothetical protein
LGAPCSSSLWVLTFAGAFAWLLDGTLRSTSELTGKVFARGLLKVAGLTTLAMMLQMTVLQQLDGGTPRYLALGVGAALYLALALRGVRAAQPRPVDRIDRIALGALLSHCLVLALIGFSFRPETHVSTGVHQPVGPCHVEATDVTGLTRYAFLCPTDFDEDYGFACAAEPPRDGATWYTICGRAHANVFRWLAGLVLLTLSATALYARLWSFNSSARS